MMKRRELITLLGGASVAWPLVARAQQPKMLRVGFSGIMARGAPHYVAFEKRMAELGYQQGRNFTFEYIQSPSIDGYELTYRELAARKVISCLPPATSRRCGRRGRPQGRHADRFHRARLRSGGEGLCGEPVTPRRQFDRHLREPARVGGKTHGAVARGIPEGASRRASLGCGFAGAG